MAQKNLRIISGLDGQRLQTIRVAGNTKIRHIMMQLHQDGKGLVTLLRGEQLLQPDTTVREAGLEDGEEVSLLWCKKYYETARLGEHAMGSNLLDQCKDLVGGIYVQIPDTADRVESYAFHGCSSLAEVVIPDTVTSIGEAAFCDCSNLTKVVIPNSVTRIGSYAFYGCSRLTQVVMPDSVTSIREGAFRGCRSLCEVVIPDSVNSIGFATFWNCSGLTQVAIPDSVTSIGNFAFFNCSSLAQVVIPNSVTSIGDEAFCGCSSLREVVMSKSLMCSWRALLLNLLPIDLLIGFSRIRIN